MENDQVDMPKPTASDFNDCTHSPVAVYLISQFKKNCPRYSE